MWAWYLTPGAIGFPSYGEESEDDDIKNEEQGDDQPNLITYRA